MNIQLVLLRTTNLRYLIGRPPATQVTE